MAALLRRKFRLMSSGHAKPAAVAALCESCGWGGGLVSRAPLGPLPAPDPHPGLGVPVGGPRHRARWVGLRRDGVGCAGSGRSCAGSAGRNRAEEHRPHRCSPGVLTGLIQPAQKRKV